MTNAFISGISEKCGSCMSEFNPWIANCALRHIGTDNEYSCYAAVWADCADTFKHRLNAHSEKQGYKLVWCEECHPVAQYLQRYGNPHTISLLARAVHQNHYVEIGELSEFSDNGLTDGNLYQVIEEIKDVAPLDSQHGIWPEKNVPDFLVETLFGHAEPTEAEISYYDGFKAIPPTKTYAIVDAGKFQWGFDEIKNCGMPFRCLFKGEAAKQLKDVAPYLIEINQESRFTQRLFKYDPEIPDVMTSVHLWHKEPGIYIRSRSDFDTIWKHFRRFTRVQNDKGEWYYFRFWEPKVSLNTLQMLSGNQKETSDFLRPRNNPPVFSILVISDAKLSVIKPVDTIDESTRAPFILTKDKYDFLNNSYRERFEKEFAKKLFDISPKHRMWLAIDSIEPIEKFVQILAYGAKEIGFRAKNEVAKLVSFSYFFGSYSLNDPRLVSLKHNILFSPENRPINRIQKFEEAVEKNNLHEIFLSNDSLRLIAELLSKISQGGEAVLTEMINAHPYLLPHGVKADFVAACHAQCKKWRLDVSEERIIAHRMCSITFTPFFMDDPLHESLKSIFLEAEDSKLTTKLIKEFDRRLNI